VLDTAFLVCASTYCVISKRYRDSGFYFLHLWDIVIIAGFSCKTGGQRGSCISETAGQCEFLYIWVRAFGFVNSGHSLTHDVGTSAGFLHTTIGPLVLVN
jgi:hypothetical protein